MCGIAGFFKTDAGQGQDLKAAGEAMHRAIAHRGPDSADVWQDPDLPLVLAHRRLAILDLSPAGAQPMSSPSGRYVTVYNGEIYNHLELKAELESAGHAFKTRCDTEVLLIAVEQWGWEKTLQKINGMFAIAIYDRRERKIHFARDRFGKKPLYIGWGGKSLIFASELKGFHAYPDFTAEIDRDVLSLYMRFGYVCAPYAIFKNVWQLLPGHFLTLDLINLPLGEKFPPLMKPYWSLREAAEKGRADPFKGDEKKAIAVFEEKLSLAVKQRMDCDVPYGAFLSGGIDSSVVTALMQRHAAHPVQTYSIGFGEGGYDESEHAAKVAAHLGTEHTTFKVTAEDALDVIPRLPEIYDEPFADASAIPTFLMSKLARRHVTVAMTGDGGDEILGGYQRHTHVPRIWGKIGWIPSSFRRAAGKLMLGVPQQTYDSVFAFYPQFGRRVHRFANIVESKNIEEVYARLLEVWPEENVVPGAKLPLIPLNDLGQWPDGLVPAEKMIYGDLLSYRSDDLMVKTDRASMAVALEARAPLMDYELCEFSWRLPLHLKIRGTEGKWILRRILEKHVPKALFDRPKSGFNVPLQAWLRGPLKAWGDELLCLDRLKKQNILSPALVASRWGAFQAGRGGHANASDLWAALMFQVWHDRWIKK
jgi:asparagine synthase (glutamine-hydrolysing)